MKTNRWSKTNFKNKNNKQLNEIYSIYTYDKAQKIIFKIKDIEKETKLTLTGKKSKRDEPSGKFCGSYKKDALKNILKFLENDISKTFKINIYCIIIEFIFHYYDLINKNNLEWIKDERKCNI